MKFGNTNVRQCACADTKTSVKARKVVLQQPHSESTGGRFSLRQSGAGKVATHGHEFTDS
jgi:hypothetical protein